MRTLITSSNLTLIRRLSRNIHKSYQGISRTLIELADQHEFRGAVEYLTQEAINARIIDAEDFFRLINTYDLSLELDQESLVHLDNLHRYLHNLEEPIVWDCFETAVMNLYYYCVDNKEPLIPLENYKQLILAIYDRFPDKAQLFRDVLLGVIGRFNRGHIFNPKVKEFNRILCEIPAFSKVYYS